MLPAPAVVAADVDVAGAVAQAESRTAAQALVAARNSLFMFSLISFNGCGEKGRNLEIDV
jgi:hypothetical protein